jgi:hypothetical protein
MAHDVFISHSSNNRTVANAVCAALEGIGIRCWIAPRDVLPGRPYAGEITRAIQQSRAFVLIFSEHSNNSEQVLREVQLAANSHLHIVQFRIDAVVPSDDLEYYLSGPHWLDAVTPPLENHLDQLRSSMKALLALSGAEAAGKVVTAEAPRPVAQPSAPIAPPSIPAKAPTKIWMWLALAAVAAVLLVGVLLFLVFGLARSKPPVTVAPPTIASTPAAPTLSAVPPNANAEPPRVTPPAIAPPSTSTLVSAEEAERYVKEFNRDMERGDLKSTAALLDDTVDYYAFGPKDKAFVAEQLRQYFALVPVRAFVVGGVKVQPGPKPTIATVIFDTRYSVRDGLGTLSTGRTRTEWDLVRRSDGLKIARTNWITYPDPSPSP